MSNYALGYLILHYQSIDITIKAINYIKEQNIKSCDKKIIVIDNKSKNNSGIMLKKIFQLDNEVEILLNQENEGFAKGNNKGFEYIKNEKYKFDALIVMNNDIMITDPKFEKKIIDIIKTNQCVDLIAPDIVTLADNHQNPMKLKPVKSIALVKVVLFEIITLLLLNIPILKQSVYNQYIRRVEKNIDCSYIEKRRKDIVPFGACIIYLKKYIENEDILFPERTFMYGEEDMLYDYCVLKNYNIEYNPNISVLHYESVATKSISKNNISVLKFKLRKMIIAKIEIIRFRWAMRIRRDD